MATKRGAAPRKSEGAVQRAGERASAHAEERRAAAVQEAAKPSGDPRKDVLYVWDTNAAPGATRVHDVIVKKDSKGQILTKGYALSNEKATAMPASHALQFLRDRSFVVSESEVLEEREETRLRPVKARSDTVDIVALEPSETIAEWSELSDEALVRRAHVIPAAEKPQPGASRAELIAFLTEASTRSKAEADRLADEGDLEGMAGKELDELFQGGGGADRDNASLGSTRVRAAPTRKQ